MIENIEELNKENNDHKNKNFNTYTKLIVTIILLIVIIAILIAFLIFNWNNKKEETNKQTGTSSVDKIELKSPYRMSSNSLENFDLAFLKLENERKNKVYSPISIKYALEMLAEGSSGTTKSQINAVIGDYKSNKYVNSTNMSFANALFIKDKYKNKIKDNYVNLLRDKYQAEVIYDSFVNANNLNSWINQRTFGLIKDLFDDISNNSFIITNALAIDMEWNKVIQSKGEDYYQVKYKHENFSTDITPLGSYPTLDFNYNNQKVKSVELGAVLNNYDIVNDLGRENMQATIEKEYREYLASGNNCGEDPNQPDEAIKKYVDKFIQELDSNYQNVKMSTDFKIYNDDNVKVFAKDLKEYNGTTLQYIGIMPKSEDLDSYIQNSTSSSINSLKINLKDIKLESFNSGKITKITGFIPLFNFDYELDLKSDLQKLGITDVFDSNKSDLSNLTSDKNAYIDKASHKSNIEFSNEGIKAAAATMEGGLGDASCGFEHIYEVPVEVIDMTFDNPYMFLIRDKKTGEVWFTGTVYEPINNQ